MRKIATLLLLLAVSQLHAQRPAQPTAPPAVQAAVQAVVHYRFGDDPDGKLGWAGPTFDDRSWPIANDGVVPAPPYDSDGFIWVRVRIPVPADAQAQLAFLSRAPGSGPDVQEFFLNGKSVGGMDNFPPHPVLHYAPRCLVLDIPRTDSPPAGSLALVALRAWSMPVRRRTAVGPNARFYADFSIDRADFQHALTNELDAERKLHYTPFLGLDFTLELLGIAVLALGIASGRRDILYGAMWLIFMPIYFAGSSGSQIFAAGYPYRPISTFFAVANAIGMYLFVEFSWEVQGLRNRVFHWIFHVCWIVTCVGFYLSDIFFEPSAFASICLLTGTFGLVLFNLLTCALQLVVILVTRRNRLVAFAMLLVNVGFFSRFVRTPQWLRWLPLSPFSLAFYLSTFVIAALLLRQTWIAWQKSRELGVEMAAARELQQQLVPLTLPDVPGMQMEAAYLPAKEVGGDFYQIIPQPDGSTLIVLGDVSGKGLKAAMKGVLALGALRTLAAEGCGPGQLLSGLNREMLRAQDGSFITCICARFALSGYVTLANAGHLNPYRNGGEVATECGLPLGLASGIEYAETMLQLNPGDQLTLLTDGVLEARDSASGELFGFDRTEAISMESAEGISRVAQAFGQDDDITVLTLTFSGAEVLHA